MTAQVVVSVITIQIALLVGYFLISATEAFKISIPCRVFGGTIQLYSSSPQYFPPPSSKGFASNSPTKAANNNTRKRTISGHAGSATKALRDAANTFDQLRSVYGKDCVTDLYVRSPLNDAALYWFVGKVARRLDDKNRKGSVAPTALDAVLSQKRIILEWAKLHLRPQNFGGSYSKNLEIWMAPGDSEMDVVQNKVVLTHALGSATQDISQGFHISDVGFNPEIYVGEEITQGGLRVKRDEQGQPLRPAFDINSQ